MQNEMDDGKRDEQKVQGAGMSNEDDIRRTHTHPHL